MIANCLLGPSRLLYSFYTQQPSIKLSMQLLDTTSGILHFHPMNVLREKRMQLLLLNTTFRHLANPLFMENSTRFLF
jgi:hypothetical protein